MAAHLVFVERPAATGVLLWSAIEGERQRVDALAVFVVYFDLGHVETTPPGRYSKVSVSLSLFVVPKIVRGVTVVI